MNTLSGTAQTIYNNVLLAMQEAEEIGGPDDYVALMGAIVAEAQKRAGLAQEGQA